MAVVVGVADAGTPPPVPGRLLGVDYGTVRVGLAVCDRDRRIASPFATFQRKDPARDAEFFRRLVADEAVTGLVVGLPVHLSGKEGKKAVEARQFAAMLTGWTGLPAVLWDERFSSLQAERALMSAGMTNKRRNDRRDRVAAQILLQSYLDAGCPPDPPSPGALE